MDRRALFFVSAATISIALAPATDTKHRWVPVWLALLYVVLALLSIADAWSRQRHGSQPDRGDAPGRDAGEEIDQPNRPVM